MKYVMFTHRKSGHKLPVMAAEMACHCDLSMGEGWVATSAGSFDPMKRKTYGHSTTLGLSPQEDDAEICFQVIAGLESIMMITQDADANKARLQAVEARTKQVIPCCERDKDKDGNCDRHLARKR